MLHTLGCVLLCASGCMEVPPVAPNTCGDRFVSQSDGEECDDQGMSAICDSDCTLPACGDGTVNPAAGEQCDDGNIVAGDGCSELCRSNGQCGNNVLDPREACDDGNTIGGDGCSTDCWIESCGNGVVEPGEACDSSGVPTAMCDRDCTEVACQDGLINPIAGEQCDDGGESARCDSDCTAAWCGDGMINAAANEQCEDAVMPASSHCSWPECGDGLTNALAGEQCDTAGASAFCDADCTAAWCGDGLVNAMADEACDDGNSVHDDGCTNDCRGPPVWSRGFAGTTWERSPRVAVDSAGNVLLTGGFYGMVDFGGGPLHSPDAVDSFVVKLDAGGQHRWSRGLGETASESISDIAVDSAGNVLLTGRFHGTVDFGGGPLQGGDGAICVVKLDADGQHLWSRGFVGFAFPTAAVDGAGNVLLTGFFRGTVDFGGGPLASAGADDIFLVKLDTSGQHLWSRSFGGTAFEGASGIAVDSAGNILLTGFFSGMLDFGGSPLHNTGVNDIFVVKLDAAGQHLWSHHFGGISYVSSRSIEVDGAGNVLVSGDFSGALDFGGGSLYDGNIFVVELDADGQHVWSRRFGLEFGSFYGLPIAVDSAGNVLLTGGFRGAVDFGGDLLYSDRDDFFAVKLDATGQHLWSRCSGGEGSAEARHIAVDSTGSVLVTGNFSETVDFGGGPLTTTDYEVFLIKLSP